MTDLLHGLTPRQIVRIGWLLSHKPDDWLSIQPSPASALRSAVQAQLHDGASDGDWRDQRLLDALARLTDAEALEVADAARVADDMTTHVPED